MSESNPDLRRGATLVRRRDFASALAAVLAALPVAVAAGRAAAQIVDWSADDAARYAAFRKAFGEYSDLNDREFAARMETLFRTLDKNPDADVVAAEVSRRLPEYRDAPRARLQRELTSLFRKARQHFESP
ncbi:MAG: hypothetical protein JNM75_00765 [Rhodospirillales bacterium]|nr:hypothetical protein [Rhodospirillales bacterium]